MVIRTLDAKQDPFHPNEDEEEILEPEIPYLSAIEALLYLAQCTRPDISFAVNLLARHSNAPTPMHWNGVKDIFRYLKDAGYMFNSHRARSQTGCVFILGDTAISRSSNCEGYALWKYLKERIFIEIEKKSFDALYVHTGAQRCKNFPGILAVRSIYDAISIDVRQNLEAVYFLHLSLQARLFLTTFGRFFFTNE
ncbi:uncharacterized protein [Malus domestica]|uniref:uncharacterized protein n=1 Tax=Malus domestica TaxID=3750 RepID=UPI0039772219